MRTRAHFSHFLSAQPGRLHFCAHSHHPWPDVSFDAQQQAWLDGATLLDSKWDKVLGEVIPTAQLHLARLLNLPDPSTLCFGGNTHELVLRLMSTIDSRPFRILTTDGEFHSFERQIRRLEECGWADVTRVPVEPFASFTTRFAEAARAGGHHLVYFSQVFYNSGYWIEDLVPLVEAVPSPRSLIVIDGYHGFMAVPTDLGRISSRAFYVGGGYKYAMSGEGVAYMHCPPGHAPRPINTGWFAELEQLSRSAGDRISYPEDARRFRGATFDPTGLYRFNAVMDWARRHQLSVPVIRAHVIELQREFLAGLDHLRHPVLSRVHLLPPEPQPRGSFLTFRHDLAQTIQRQLLDAAVVTDVRGDRLRIGFGLYQDRDDVTELLDRVAALPRTR